MAKAKILKLPYMGWRFDEIETDADGHIPLATVESLIRGSVDSRPPCGEGLDGLKIMKDEKGRWHQMILNPPATILAGIREPKDAIFGNTIVCASDANGCMVGLTDAHEQALRKRLAELELNATPYRHLP